MIRHIQPMAWLAALFIACQWLAPATMRPVSMVQASVPGITCNAAMTGINFGNIDSNGIQANYNLQTTGYLTYYCTNTTASAQTITACFSIGNPGGATQRTMSNSNDRTLNYGLYQDAANTVQWGSTSSPGTWGTPYTTNITVPANGTSPPATATIYATIASNQGSIFGIHLGVFLLPAGNYSASYGAGNVAFDIVSGANKPCSTATGGGNAFPFNVTASVQQTCQVNTNPLVFPTTAGDPSGATASTTLTVQCTGSHTGYQIGLDNGQNYDGTNRRMRGGPTISNYVSYGLYQNSNYTTPWGNTTGTGGNTVTGTSNPQTFTVYGKINAGQGRTVPGNYFDAVTVYVYY